MCIIICECTLKEHKATGPDHIPTKLLKTLADVSVNDVVNVRASCLSLSMSACRQRWIFLRIGFARCACADE